MEENTDLTKVLLAELVDALGGVAKLDANEVLEHLKDNTFKSVKMTMHDGEIILEVFDEDEN